MIIEMCYNGLMVRKNTGSVMSGGMVISGVLLTLTVVSGVALSSSGASAEEAIIDTLNVKINSACTLSGTGTGTHNATINPGAYEDEIGTTTLKAMCNDASGFSIYAAGYTGNIVGSANSNKLVGRSNGGTIVTGLAESGDTSNWAMKLATDSTATYPITITSAPNTSGGADATFADYHVVPNEYTKVATRLQGTDVGTSAVGSTLTTTYAVFITAGQVGDTYDGKVIYTLVHPNDAATPLKPLPDSACPASSICYAPNSSDIDGSMSSMGSISESATAGKQTGVSTNGTAVLRAPNFSRDGYGFAGWSTDFEATSASKVYGPNETITTSTTVGAGDADVSQKGLILYPVWIESSGNIQNWTGCSGLTQASYNSETGVLSATLASMTALTDERDGNTYTVAKLADGNCWMTENLRLDAENSADVSLAQGFGDDTANNRGKFIGLADSENSNFTGSTSSATEPTNANSLYYAGTQSGTATMNIGQIDYAGYRIPRYNNNNTNRTLRARYSGTGSSTYYQWYAYGNYYNWPAAMASTSYLTSYSASESANTSICPTGWRLPTGGDKTRITTDHNNEFWNLVVVNLNNNTLPANYDSSTQPYYDGSTEAGPVDMLVRAFPNNFVYSGYFVGSTAYSRGSRGNYLSSSASSNGGAYAFYFYSSYVYPGPYSSVKNGATTVRCLLDS